MTRNSGISVIRTVPKLRDRVSAWRSRNQRIGLVPTMGALHEGHLALVKRALETCDRVVVSLFVNPTQFGENEDLSTYPRDEATDRAILGELGVHVLYAPTMEEMYPQGLVTSVRVPELAEGLCGAFRPGHFAGVATVVTKLFSQSLPDMAVFGEKDYQQLQVIRGLVRDLDIPVHIEAVATVREADGLALSSRNAYLSPAERAIAPTLFRALIQAAAAIEAGGAVRGPVGGGGRGPLGGGVLEVGYFGARGAPALKGAADAHAPARILAAAHLGTTRLIDNVAVAAGAGD